MQRIGPYQLMTKLGQGGMAEVWKGVRRSDIGGAEKTVAIKLIASHSLHDPKFRGLFVREARVSMLLNHSTIAQVFDVGVEDDRLYMVMEYVNGMNAKELILSRNGEPLPLHVVVYIIAEVLRALTYAHELEHDGDTISVVHRDISPHNIMISSSGEVKVTDFGVASISSEETNSKAAKGKLQYMPPEQLKVASRKPTIDIYAVGAVLHELLELRPLREPADYARMLGMVLLGELSPLTRADVPDHLRRLRDCMLETNPDARISSAAEALQQLYAWPGYRNAALELGAMVKQARRIGQTPHEPALHVIELALGPATTHAVLTPGSPLPEAQIPTESAPLAPVPEAEIPTEPGSAARVRDSQAAGSFVAGTVPSHPKVRTLPAVRPPAAPIAAPVRAPSERSFLDTDLDHSEELAEHEAPTSVLAFDDTPARERRRLVIGIGTTLCAVMIGLYGIYLWTRAQTRETEPESPRRSASSAPGSATTTQTTPVEPTPDEPPTEPTLAEPTPTEDPPTEPTPTEPTLAEPTLAEPPEELPELVAGPRRTTSSKPTTSSKKQQEKPIPPQEPPKPASVTVKRGDYWCTEVRLESSGKTHTVALDKVSSKQISLAPGSYAVKLKADCGEEWTSAGKITVEAGATYSLDARRPPGVDLKKI